MTEHLTPCSHTPEVCVPFKASYAGESQVQALLTHSLHTGCCHVVQPGLVQEVAKMCFLQHQLHLTLVPLSHMNILYAIDTHHTELIAGQGLCHTVQLHLCFYLHTMVGRCILCGALGALCPVQWSAISPTMIYPVADRCPQQEESAECQDRICIRSESCFDWWMQVKGKNCQEVLVTLICPSPHCDHVVYLHGSMGVSSFPLHGPASLPLSALPRPVLPLRLGQSVAS